MTKPTLCIFLGAICASSWWGCYTYNNPHLGIVGFATAIMAVVIIVSETIDLFDKK